MSVPGYMTGQHLHGSYAPSEVQFLLKLLPAEYVSVPDKEQAIQSGQRHYSEMLSREAAPDQRYRQLYEQAMVRNGWRVAQDVWALACTLAEREMASTGLAICSLARAGTPVGVLLLRALRMLGVPARHYSVSIIRDRGLDQRAMRYVLAGHEPEDVVFVDGWTGKGAIRAELDGPRGSRAVGVEPYLCVLADLAGVADLAATGEDYVIPSGLMNGVVSGLLSRTVWNDHIGPEDFHGAVLLDHMAPADVSVSFVDRITQMFPVRSNTVAVWEESDKTLLRRIGTYALNAVAIDARVSNMNNIKPGVAEASRAVLRRVPDRVYVENILDPEVAGLMHLCRKASVMIHPMPVRSQYKAITVIRGNGAE